MLIIIPFLLVSQAGILQSWLLIIYEAGALLAGLILFGRFYSQQPIYRTVFAGAILLALSFVLSLLLPASYLVITQVFLALGITTFFSGYLVVNNHSRILKKKYLK
jgi:predicted MFS family arabinose efflux permease